MHPAVIPKAKPAKRIDKKESMARESERIKVAGQFPTMTRSPVWISPCFQSGRMLAML
jgi:hypothetical protein